MSFESLEQAAEALASANADTEAPESATPPAPEPEVPAERASEEAPVTPTEPQATEGATDESDSFTRVDLTSLTEGLDPEAAAAVEQAYKSFQADYTRKTQEVAPFRRLAEELGGDVDALRASVEFAQNLQTNPQFALEVHAELSQALEAAGLTKAEADAEASRQVVEAADEFGADEFSADDPRDKAIQELLSFKEDFEAREQERMLEAEITRQEMAIRQNNPTFTDEDLDTIVEMSFAHGGNLFAAEKAYKGLQQRWMADYMKRKESVDANPTPPAPSGPAQQPQSFGDDLNAAHKAAMRHLRASLGG